MEIIFFKREHGLNERENNEFMLKKMKRRKVKEKKGS